MALRKYDEFKNFIEFNSLDKILQILKEYLPENLKYIRIYQDRVGYQQYDLHLDYYDDRWRKIRLGTLPIDFALEISERGDFEVYDDYIEDCILNTLTGFNRLKDVNWKDITGEFYEKIRPETEYFYKVKN